MYIIAKVIMYIERTDTCRGKKEGGRECIGRACGDGGQADTPEGMPSLYPEDQALCRAPREPSAAMCPQQYMPRRGKREERLIVRADKLGRGTRRNRET